MALKGVAQETLAFLDAGGFTAPDGTEVRFGPAQRAAEAGTRLYAPDALQTLLDEDGPGGSPPTIEVTGETTQVAALRMAADGPVALLNFASAKNPGGGFIRGAKAQEEDVARCSGLYPCLMRCPEYYAVNRAHGSLLYTDHLIYSPAVPFFRSRSRDLLNHWFPASVLTAPAPNAGEVLRRDPDAGPAIEEALRRRAGMVLAVFAAHGDRRLVLGAWGCGVFRNDPAMVADAFGRWLEGPRFAGAFDAVCFAVYDPSKSKANLTAFRERLG